MPRLHFTIVMLVVMTAAASVSAQGRQSAAASTRLVEQMEKADLDGDGAVSRDEILRYRATQWQKMDRNTDGHFTRDDLPGFARSRWDSGRLANLRSQFDVNRDGRVSHQEFVGGPTAAFDLADTNHDGYVTKAEMQTLRESAGE